MQHRIGQLLQGGILRHLQQLGHNGIVSARKASTQLEENLGTVLMDLVNQGLRLLEGLRALVQPLTHHHGVYGNHTGDKEAYVVFGTFYIVVPCFFVVMGAIHVLHNVGTLHGGDDNTVANLTIANSKGCKQFFVLCHKLLLSGSDSY